MKELEKIRVQIDWIDKEIMKNLDKRFELVSKIGKIKLESNLEIIDLKREEMINHYIEMNTDYEENIKKIYAKIMDESKEIQK
ncbi:MAG: chorismate mutase [Bacilli bacterium]